MSKFTAGGPPSPLAAKLIGHLQREGSAGGEFGIPSVTPGENALSHHAEAFLSNAAQLCHENPVHDFSVFGALYCLRHGLELWLKYIIQNNMMDRTLGAIFEDDASTLDAVAGELGINGKEDKKRKALLCRSLCALKNHWVDRLKYPEVWEANIAPQYAVRAIQEVRVKGSRPRNAFARFWCVPVPGHSVRALWEQARDTLVELRPAVVANNHRFGGGSANLGEMEAAIDFVDYYDPDGDAFRYPTSLTGKWYLHLPPVNLQRLGVLASRLEQTVRDYTHLLDEVYEFSTLRYPEPSPPMY